MEALAEDSLLVETEVEAIIQEENNENELDSMGKVTKGWKVAPPLDINVPQDLSIGAVREWALGPHALKLAFSSSPCWCSESFGDSKQVCFDFV
jgi:hypothetical protein